MDRVTANKQWVQNEGRGSLPDTCPRVEARGRSAARVRHARLHDERAVHAQERRLRSPNSLLFDVPNPERGGRAKVRRPGPIENGDRYQRGQIEGRFRDREHLPGVLAARAIVLVLPRSFFRGGTVMRVSRGRVAAAVRRVALLRAFASIGSDRPAFGFRSDGHAPGQQGTEIAAAERHGQRQQKRQHEPNWAAAVEHT